MIDDIHKQAGSQGALFCTCDGFFLVDCGAGRLNTQYTYGTYTWQNMSL